jgi:divalent metal cation (Fe/Co/Zn/Cd) transporter
VRAGAADAHPAWERLATRLLWVTVAWNVAEGAIAVSSGVLAGSVALVAFGLDSYIEVAAAAVLLWSVRAPSRERSAGRERIAYRAVGATFVALAAYVVADATVGLTGSQDPAISPAGMAIAVASLVVMPVLAMVKRRNALRLGNAALVEESTETFLCSYLSLALLVGLAANAAAGWWWADAAAALAMVPWLLREGVEGLRGEAG